MNWNSVNYVLNHQSGYSMEEIQSAIWVILGQPVIFAGQPDAAAQSLIHLAQTVGKTFVPDENGVVAVFLYFDSDLNDHQKHQSMIVEVACTRTQGFWKNHPDSWPVQTLTIGGVTLTKAQLLSIMDMPVKGNAVIQLLHQLIAAMLNQAHGAYISPTAQTTLKNASDALKGFISVSGGSAVLGSVKAGGTLTNYADMLDRFNSGMLTGVCSTTSN